MQSLNLSFWKLTLAVLLTIFASVKCLSQQKFIQTENGIKLKVNRNNLQLYVVSSKIIRVRFYSDDIKNEKQSLVVINSKLLDSAWDVIQKDEVIELNTASLKIKVDIKNGNIIFEDSSGNVLLSEKERSITPSVVLGENTYNIQQTFHLSKEEAIYGLGQHQDSVMNWRGHSVDLQQLNTNVSVPVIVSTKGYGILWDNYSLTKFNDDKNAMRLWSEVGDGIDYYFISGKNIDEVIAGYRELTGKAPLFGKWGYGFIQSKEHYNTQTELLSTLKEFRKRMVPIDMIVQDWFYWVPNPWGSHVFDPERYPNPKEMTDEVHNMHAKIMISVWAKFDSGSTNYEELKSRNLLLKPTSILMNPLQQYYDPYSPEGRKIYWRQIKDSLYIKGFDAWWLDATEPEMAHAWTKSEVKAMNNHMGTGARYFNTYPLMTTMAVYNGQRAETDAKRVFILTRSAFAGQQRNAAVTWSGDIYAYWNVFRKQIPAGLNFCFTGIPYWTTDIGAFFVTLPDGCKDNSYKELFTRWYQFGAFCPIFRVHGTNTPREIWQFGEKGTWAYDTQLKFDNLRYRLLPYIYSTAWMVTNKGYTMMRGLAFDFYEDKNIYNIDDQYMFGPAFLVNPVTHYMYYPWIGPDEGAQIHSENLFTAEGKNGGLTAEYFEGTNFEKKFKSLIDSTFNHNWGNSYPLKGMTSDYFSIRWRGKILAPETGKYKFITSADDGIRLWVDGKLIIDDWKTHATESHTGLISLNQGKKYDIKMEYFENMGGANVKLGWRLPSYQSNKKITLPEKTIIVYLPETAGWINFWTGRTFKGGQKIKTPAPIDIMPLFVKAGSIVPMGPFMQYSTEKQEDPVELRIYLGADGKFRLYEDENDNYNYEKGIYATIDFTWNDAGKILTISDRKGEFPGMLKERTFNIVLVKVNHGNGVGVCTNPDKTVKYSGSKLKIQF
jgi:alpha-D-xyloside xylohydrolase